MYFIALKFKVENNKKYDREINHNEKNEWWLVCTVLSQDVSTFRENKWDLSRAQVGYIELIEEKQ